MQELHLAVCGVFVSLRQPGTVRSTKRSVALTLGLVVTALGWWLLRMNWGICITDSLYAFVLENIKPNLCNTQGAAGVCFQQSALAGLLGQQFLPIGLGCKSSKFSENCLYSIFFMPIIAFPLSKCALHGNMIGLTEFSWILKLQESKGGISSQTLANANPMSRPALKFSILMVVQNVLSGGRGWAHCTALAKGCSAALPHMCW